MEKIKIEQIIRSDICDDEIEFLNQIGVNYVALQMFEKDAKYDVFMKLVEKLRKNNLEVYDAGCVEIYKHHSLMLGEPERDDYIEKYNQITNWLGEAGIHINYATWEPNKVLSTNESAVGRYSRGAKTRIVDMNEILSRPNCMEREYLEEEIWNNFKYFLDNVVPTCKKNNVRIALHPNDPPYPKYVGIHNLITSLNDYKRAFSLVNNDPVLGVKMCMGCWLEGGKSFGNVLEDIEFLQKNDKILLTHFRTVSAPMPYFEEQLIQDGYFDMFKIMKKLVDVGYTGATCVDHVPTFNERFGGKTSAYAHQIGYLQALARCAYDLKKN